MEKSDFWRRSKMEIRRQLNSRKPNVVQFEHMLGRYLTMGEVRHYKKVGLIK